MPRRNARALARGHKRRPPRRKRTTDARRHTHRGRPLAGSTIESEALTR